MISQLSLQNFRNYTKKTFDFSEGATLIVGPNAIGKTNILEAIYTLAIGKSFRADSEQDVILEGQQVSRIESSDLEIIYDNRSRFTKLYRVNGVGKRQIDFVGNLRAVLFCPQDIEIVTDSPSIRRKYLDLVLTQVYKDYRIATHVYEKVLRQRNKLLWRIREDLPAGRQEISIDQLEYWNKLLIENGAVIHKYRKHFLEFLKLPYDHSIISEERLEKYSHEEIGAATTLIGPHRDDFKILKKGRPVKSFGSRGEQRLAIFQIKMGELDYLKQITKTAPILLLDDIFSELDHDNRHHILEAIPKQQTIMTTTDVHLVDRNAIRGTKIIELV